MSDGATEPVALPTEPRKSFLVRHYRVIATTAGAVAVVVGLVLAYLQTAYAPGWFPFGKAAPGPSSTPAGSASPTPGASAGSSASASPAASSSPANQPASGKGGPPVGQVNPSRPPRSISPTPVATGPQTTYVTSERYAFTLKDKETLQFQGTSRPNKGAATAWGHVIYSDVDHQLNYWHLTDTGPNDVGSWQLCHANAKTYDAIHLDGVDTAHAFCRPESVVEGDPRVVSYVRVTDASHISDSPPSVSVEVWFVTASG
jgi:hypothetical protein